MSHNEEHHQQSPKKVYFGIPIGFAIAFWLIIILCLKACDGGSNSCCKEGKECSKECKAKCEAEGKTECAKGGEEKKEGVAEDKKEETAPVSEEKRDAPEPEKAPEPAEHH